MFDWLKDNYITVLAAVGAGVVLFWPQIKAALSAASVSPAPSPGGSLPQGCCCCPPPEESNENKRSDVLVEQYQIRTWLEQHRLDEGALQACDKVINVIASAKPSIKRCEDDKS